MSSSAAFGAFDVVDRVEVVVSLSGVALDEVEVFGTFRGLPGRFLAGAMFEAWEVDAPPLSEFIKTKYQEKMFVLMRFLFQTIIIIYLKYNLRG